MISNATATTIRIALSPTTLHSEPDAAASRTSFLTHCTRPKGGIHAHLAEEALLVL